MTFLGVTVFQGIAACSNYVQGTGGILDPTLPRIVCDGTAHEYNFTVLRDAAYADRKFRAGPATAIYVVTQCTEVAPGETRCTPTAEETRVRVKVTP